MGREEQRTVLANRKMYKHGSSSDASTDSDNSYQGKHVPSLDQISAVKLASRVKKEIEDTGYDRNYLTERHHCRKGHSKRASASVPSVDEDNKNSFGRDSDENAPKSHRHPEASNHRHSKRPRLGSCSDKDHVEDDRNQHHHHHEKHRRHRRSGDDRQADKGDRHREEQRSRSAINEEKPNYRHTRTDSYHSRHGSRSADDQNERNKHHHSRDRVHNEHLSIKQERNDPAYDRAHRRQNDQWRRDTRAAREQQWGKWASEEDGRRSGMERTDAKGKPKESVNFEKTGKLLEDTNVYKGVVIKYSEPEEARKPSLLWRLYPFKGKEALPVMYIHRQSAYLIGKQRLIVDLPVDHPSCSKQHAVLQYRLVPYTKKDGMPGHRVRPYIIDLNSTNGTFVNNKKVEPQRYMELREQDVLKFGFSSREYVLMHDKVNVEGVQLDEEDQEGGNATENVR